MSADDKYVTISTPFTAIATGPWMRVNAATVWTHQLVVDGQSGNTATVVVEGTNDPTGDGAVTIASLSASYGTPDAVPGVMHTWLYVRHRCTAIGGTGPVASALTSGV